MEEYKSLRDWIYIKHDPSRGMYQRHNRENIQQNIFFQTLRKSGIICITSKEEKGVITVIKGIFAVLFYDSLLFITADGKSSLLVSNPFVNTSLFHLTKRESGSSFQHQSK